MYNYKIWRVSKQWNESDEVISFGTAIIRIYQCEKKVRDS